MAVMYGADAEELEQIAAELDGYERELGQLLLEGVGAVSLVGLSATLKTIWMGNRASEFAGIWEARHLLRIREVQAMLKEAAGDLRRNASQQREASGGWQFQIPGNSGITLPWFGSGPIPMQWLEPGGSGWTELNERMQESLEGIGLMLEVGSFVKDPLGSVKPFYWALMGGVKIGGASRGLTDAGMWFSKHISHSDDAFNYFRSAKGGFRSAASKLGLLEKGSGLKLAAVGAGISGLQILHAGITEGFGSSEFAYSAVDDGISGVVGFVPGGGLAYMGGKGIGDLIYHHTPVGGMLLDANPVSSYIDEADRLVARSDAALRNGDYESAIRESERAMEEARRAREESEGWTGMKNAAKSIVPFW